MPGKNPKPAVKAFNGIAFAKKKIDKEKRSEIKNLIDEVKKDG